MPYEFYYWPMIQGRGEVVRLALEEAGVDYMDVARSSKKQEDNRAAILAILQDPDLERPPFAPPFLLDNGVMIAQAAAILQYLAPKINMHSNFLPKLINDPLGDPGVIVEFLCQQRALQFDLGDLSSITIVNY